MQAEPLLEPAGDANASVASRYAETAAINPYSASTVIQLEGALSHDGKRIDHSPNHRDFLSVKTARVAIHRLDRLAGRTSGQQKG